MPIADVLASFRRIDRGKYPEPQGYSPKDIWKELGSGGLFLVALRTRHMRLQVGDRVLDRGCGRGEASIVQAKHLGVQVVAVDLWTTATFLHT